MTREGAPAEHVERDTSVLEHNGALREKAFSEVTAEFFRRADAIAEALSAHPTVERSGRVFDIRTGEEWVVAEYQQLVDIAKELKQAAEYRNDYHSAEVAAYYLDLSEAKLREIQTALDMWQRYGDAVAPTMERFVPGLKQQVTAANDNIPTQAKKAA